MATQQLQTPSQTEPALCTYQLRQPVSDLLADLHEMPLLSHLVFVPLNQAEVAPQERVLAQLGVARAETTADAMPVYDYDAELKHRQSNRAAFGDAQAWKPALYGEHATAGVVKTTRDGPGEYGVVVRTGGGPAGARLYDFALANKSMSIGELLHTPEWRLASDLAERNALRLAAQVGAAVAARPGRAVPHIMQVRRDTKAVPAFAGAAPPLMAVPAVHIRYNTLVPTADGDVAFMRHVGAPDHGQMLAHRDHLNGFALTRVGSETAARRVFDVNHHVQQDDNAKFSALKTRNRNEWRTHVQRHYLTAGGQSATSAAPQLWSVSERREPAADAKLLYPVAMVIQAKPAKQVSE